LWKTLHVISNTLYSEGVGAKKKHAAVIEVDCEQVFWNKRITRLFITNNREAVADCQGICLVIARFQVQCLVGPSAAVVSLGKKLYSHCLSHQLLNREHIVLCIFRAQLKNSFP